MDNIATTFVENAVKRASARGSIASPLAADIAKDQEKQRKEVCSAFRALHPAIVPTHRPTALSTPIAPQREQGRMNEARDREARTSSIPEEKEEDSRISGGAAGSGDVEMQEAAENPIHSDGGSKKRSISSDARDHLSRNTGT